LTPARLEQPQLLQLHQQGVEQTLFGLSGRQARTKFAQHGVVEPGIGQLEPEQVFPVQPSAHRVCRRAIGQVLNELEHRHPGQASRRLGRLSAPGKQIGKPRVGVQWTHGIGDRQAEDTTRKSRAGNPAGFFGNLERWGGLE
jgi:hypothetical protein